MLIRFGSLQETDGSADSGRHWPRAMGRVSDATCRVIAQTSGLTKRGQCLYWPLHKRSEERLKPGLGSTKNQGVHVVGAFIGVHHFQIHQVSRHPEFITYTVTPEHIPG